MERIGVDVEGQYLAQATRGDELAARACHFNLARFCPFSGSESTAASEWDP